MGNEKAGTPAKDQPIDKVAQAVNAWFVDHIHNTVASQDTQIYNHLAQAKDQLVNKIKEALANESV